MAAATQRIRLGVSVLVTTVRNPVHLAKQLGSLDHLSKGRLIVGVGLGGRTEQYPVFGVPPDRRVGRFVEGLQVLKALWEQPRASYDGRWWKLSGQPMEPKPVQRPHPPIWFGGHHPDALRRAVRHGDCWMGAGASTIQQFKEQVPVIRRGLEAAGRDPSTFPISKRVYLALDDDEARAEGRLREWFGGWYRNADLASAVSVWGNPSRCVEGLSEVIEAGAQMLMLNPVFDQLDHLEALHREVIPQLRAP